MFGADDGLLSIAITGAHARQLLSCSCLSMSCCFCSALKLKIFTISPCPLLLLSPILIIISVILLEIILLLLTPLLLITIIIIISCPPSCLLRKSCYKLRREPTQPIDSRSLSLHLWQSFFRLLVRCNGLVSLVNNYGDFHNITIAAFSSQPIDSRSLSLEKEKKK